jgi:hypothetical protein
MLARVVTWEGGNAEAMEKSAAEINEQSGDGPPPGVPAKEFLLLQDPANGKSVAIITFESEDDYRQGDEVLNSMDPPGEGMGQRVSVEKLEIAARFQA